MATVRREPNQVKWVGVRPGHNGEQVLIHINTNVNTVLYTVPADKLLLIFSWQLVVAQAAAVSAQLELQTAVPAAYYQLAYNRNTATFFHPQSSQSLTIPIEVPATYRVNLIANGTSLGGVQGILIDA